MRTAVVEALRAFEVYAADVAAAKTPLSSLQARLARWQNNQFGYVPTEQACLGAAEEVGELCHAVLKGIQKIRGFDDKKVLQDAAGDAIADAAIYLMQVATSLCIDFEAVLTHTAERVMDRNWLADRAAAHLAVDESAPATSDVGCIEAGCFGKDPVFHRAPCRHAKPGAEDSVTVDGGKYTFRWDDKVSALSCLRHGEPWIEKMDGPGSKAILSLFHRCLELEAIARR